MSIERFKPSTDSADAKTEHASKPFAKKIETADVAEHEAELGEQLKQAELAFAQLKYSQMPGESRGSFSDCLARFTPAINILKESLYDSLPRTETGREQKVQALLAEAKLKIDQLYDPVQPESSLIAIQGYLDKFDKNQQPVQHDNQIGFLYYNELDPARSRRGNIDLLKKAGFHDYDEALEIHMEEKFKNKDASFSGQEIKRVFGELAKLIVEKHPQRQAVMGTSWLMDHPIFQRLGFKTIEGSEDPYENYNNSSAWMQLVDKDGQLDQKRFAQAMATGELPYKVKTGYITTEDFLRRYLPPEARGDITLKETNPAWAERQKRLSSEVLTIRNEWDKLAPSKTIDVDNFISRYPLINEAMKGAGIHEVFVAGLKRAAEQGWTMKDFGSHEVFPKELDQLMDDYNNRDKYVDKKVVIE